jgi:L-lactate utilization protein LutB
MYDQQLIDKTMENLRKNNMEAVFVPNKEELIKVIPQYVHSGDRVAFGGSMTLKQTGVYDYLRQQGEQGKIIFLDRDADGADAQQMMREAFSSDVYFVSTNALTENGWLYNVDGNGNRVAAMIFGPKSVVVIVGYNKLVHTKEEAIERVQKIAAPLNAKRLHTGTPCEQTGECMHCMSDHRICCSYTFLGKQRVKNRTKVIIVGEEYGY